MKCIACIRSPVSKSEQMNYFQRLFIFNIFYAYKLRNIEKEIIMGCEQSLTETPHSSGQLDLQIKPDGLLFKQCESAQNVVFPKNKFTLTDQHRKFIFQSCKSYSFFSDLPDQKLKELSTKFVMSLSSEQWLFKEGSIAGFFFIIAEGYVDVIKKGHLVRKLGPGDCFGEMALLYGIKRSSSIRIVKQFRTKNFYFVLNRNDFLETTQYYNESKNSEFLNLVSTHSLFTYLTSREKFELAQSSLKISFKKGQRILSKYDEPYCFFVIKNGGIKLNFPNKKFLDINEGNIFGYFGSNTIQCSATSNEETVTYAVSKDQVNKILSRNIKYLYLWNKVRYVLINCNRIQSLSLQRIEEITALFTFKFIRKQEPICLCHSSIKKIYIPLTCNENSELIGVEQLFTGKNKYSFDLLAEKSGYCGEIDSNLFMRLVEDEKLTIEKQFLEGFNLNNSQTVAVFSHSSKALFLCKEKRFNMNYMLERASQNDQKLIQQLKMKAQILNIANCRLVQGIYFFGLKDNEYFLVKQFIRGSTIRENMLKIGIIPYSISRFYIACIVIIIECLHSKSIACKSLSINDFKIDQTGYLCINEFQATLLSEKSQKKQINKEMIQDFKRVGLISYELLIGIPLYNYQSKEININFQQINFPINFKRKEAKDLILALLVYQNLADNRWQRIKSMKFFKGIDWKALLKKQLEAPIMPALMICNPLLV